MIAEEIRQTDEIEDTTLIGSVSIGTVPTPWGAFGAAMTSRGLARLTFPAEGMGWCGEWVRRWMPGSTVEEATPVFRTLSDELTAYLEGGLREFSTPLDMRGTPFRLEVWRALLEIPYGETRSYGWVAQRIGRPTAVRAVGSANGANPVPVIVPCHRVIGSDGTLTGYGGGLDLKDRLLRVEGISTPAGQTSLW